MIVTCKTCSKSFSKPASQLLRSKSGNSFCSRSCSAAYNNVGLQRNPPRIRICRSCKTEYVTSYKNKSLMFCLSCGESSKSDYWKNKTLAEYHSLPSVAGKHPSWRNAHLRGLCRSWNKELTLLPCYNCGYSKHVELAHIKSVSSFSLTTTVGEINSRSNVVQLCRNCHWEFDHGDLVLEPSGRFELPTPAVETPCSGPLSYEGT